MFPAHRFCPTENASQLKRSPESGPRKILPMSNRTRRSIRPFTDWLFPRPSTDRSWLQRHPEDYRITDKATHPSRCNMIDVLTREGKVRWCFTASQPPTVSDSRTPFQIGELTDGRMRPITFATLLLIFKLPHRAASAGPATPRCAFRRRSIRCATCFRPATEPCTGASSPFSKTRSWVGPSGRLRRGMSALPERMRVIERDLLKQASAGVPSLAPTAYRHQPASISSRRLHLADDRGSRNV